jgi:hypothetical protein
MSYSKHVAQIEVHCVVEFYGFQQTHNVMDPSL